MENQNDSQTIALDYQAVQHLKITRKWTSFLSITTFVIMGLMICVVIGVLVASLPDSAFKAIAMVPVILLFAIYFLPIYYLYLFSKFSSQAVTEYDQQALTEALKYLKMHYRFMGIVMICVIALYVVLGIGAVVSGQLMHLFI